MKYLYTLLLLLSTLLTFGQKNNYNSYLSYEDEYVDRILYAQRYVSSAADYLFYGTVKSVYVEQFDGKGKLSSQPAKLFFDEARNTIKQINFNINLKDSGAVEFYHNPKFRGTAVIKSAYTTQNGNTRHSIKSTIDTTKKMIINHRFNNDQLSEIDTVFYIQNYKPVVISNSSVRYTNKSLRKMAYLENGKLYKEIYQRGNEVLGMYIRYDDAGKWAYLYKINAEDFDTISVDYESESRTKEQEFIWHNEKDFEFHEDKNSSAVFDFRARKLLETKRKATYTTFFNEQLLPLKRLSVDKQYGLNMESTFEYNKHQDLVLERNKNEGTPMVVKTYKYRYDEKNNWIERKEFENNKLIFTTKRTIAYE